MMRWIPVAICWIAGCGTPPYPPGLAYSEREDPLVVQLPTTAAQGPPPAGRLDEFIATIPRQGGKLLEPTRLAPELRTQLKRAIDAAFGSPAAPEVHCDDSPTQELANHLGLQPVKLVAGSQLYRRHCLQCHGLTGDGRGPTGQWIYPSPRDFRQGVFKFVSTNVRKPSQADLHHTLNVGIEGTSMPAFSLLSDAEQDAVLAYVLHLSIRGETEYRALKELLGDDGTGDSPTSIVQELIPKLVREWHDADFAAVVPGIAPALASDDEKSSTVHQASIKRGFALFRTQASGCASCHDDFGRRAKYFYDVWGSTVRATDLTQGTFRGGKRPIDLFQRIRGGISPSGMPATTSLSDPQVWDLVHFLDALASPRLLPPDIRAELFAER